MKDPTKLVKYLRYIARTILIIISVFWFLFALFSGAEEYGGGLKGILMNSPNALPWLSLLVFVFLAWKWELIGGILIVMLGGFTVYFFKAYESLPVFIIISLPLIILGGFYIFSWYLAKNKSDK